MKFKTFEYLLRPFLGEVNLVLYETFEDLQILTQLSYDRRQTDREADRHLSPVTAAPAQWILKPHHIIQFRFQPGFALTAGKKAAGCRVEWHMPAVTVPLNVTTATVTEGMLLCIKTPAGHQPDSLRTHQLSLAGNVSAAAAALPLSCLAAVFTAGVAPVVMCLPQHTLTPLNMLLPS